MKVPATLFCMALMSLGYHACFGQGRTVRLEGKWRIDVPASVEATKAKGNEHAIKHAPKIAASAVFQFNVAGTFSWSHTSNGVTIAREGKWDVKREARAGIRIHFKYPEAENHATIVIAGKDTLHFHFAETYPVCVYKRVLE